MRKFALCLAVLLSLSACAQTVPKEALELTQESLQQRQTQTRRFETKDEKKLLSAGGAGSAGSGLQS